MLNARTRVYNGCCCKSIVVVVVRKQVVLSAVTRQTFLVIGALEMYSTVVFRRNKAEV